MAISSAFNQMRVSAGRYVFKYEGDMEYMSLNTLLTSQFHFAQAITQIKEFIHPDTDLDIKVKALPRGSFQIELLTNISYIQHLLTPETVAYAKEIFETLFGIITLIKELKGSKAKEITKNDNSVNITTGDGSEVQVNQNVYHIYLNRPSVTREIAETFEPINIDEDVTSVNISDEKAGVLLDIPRADFEFLASAPEAQEINKKEEIKNAAELVVYKVVFDKGPRKWQFYLDGYKISASIHDIDFLAKVELGEPFAIGDVLIVNIQVDSEYDERLGIFLPKNYKVLKVIEHRHRERIKQSDIFDNDDAS